MLHDPLNFNSHKSPLSHNLWLAIIIFGSWFSTSSDHLPDYLSEHLWSSQIWKMFSYHRLVSVTNCKLLMFFFLLVAINENQVVRSWVLANTDSSESGSFLHRICSIFLYPDISAARLYQSFWYLVILCYKVHLLSNILSDTQPWLAVLHLPHPDFKSF